jgi:triosephosphate isomerase
MNASRKYLIAGNWKMNKTASEAVDLVDQIILEVGKETDVSLVVCPPFTALDAVSKKIGGTNLQLGGQNMHYESSGAYTGEISASMLRDQFVSHVILGHSERRMYFGEDDTLINRKVQAAIANNLKPILCVGETLEERESGKTLEVVARQVRGGLRDIKKAQSDMVIIAYEPVWAIGTGKTATPEMAQEVHKAIRGLLAELFGKTAAAKIRILYGGSMKPENAEELLKQEDIDGGLIGGASLEAKSFAKLAKIAGASVKS